MENNDRLKRLVKTKIAISNFKEESIAMKKNKKPFAKIAVVASVCLILTSGIVFAKDIEKIVRKLFTNTTPAIEEATRNGYVQSVYKDFVYDQGIGVRVDNIVLDEINLNISLQYENESKKENIKSIRMNKFIIKTDTGEKIFDNNQKYSTSLDDVYTAQKMDWFNQPEKISDYVFKDSILFTMGERSKEKKELKFIIQSFDVTYQDDTKEEILGDWNFNVEITKEMRKSQTIEYKLLEENKNIESCKATLYPTGLELELILKEPLNLDTYLEENADKVHGHMLFYYKENDEFIFPAQMDFNNIKYTMQYDNIGTYSKVPETIEIYADPFESSIYLIKE